MGVQTGNGSGNERRDQLSFGFPDVLQAEKVRPWPIAAGLDPGLGDRRRMQGRVSEVAGQGDAVPFDDLAQITCHFSL